MSKNNGDGVSPIIATILMLVLTVLLVSIVSVPLISSSVDSLNDSMMLIDKIIQKPTPTLAQTATPSSTPTSTPTTSPYYTGGSEPFENISSLIDSINDWKPGVVKPLGSGDGFELIGNLEIAENPLVISADLLRGGTFVIKDSGGSIQRAPGRSDSPLLVLGSSGGLHIISGALKLDGMGQDSGAPLLEITSGAVFDINGNLILQNNVNRYATMPGGGLWNNGDIILDGEITISGNTAPKGGGIYNSGTLELNSNKIYITGNTATEKGGGIYNAGGSVTLTKIGYIRANTAPAGNGKSYYAEAGSINAEAGSINNEISGLITTSTGDKYRDTDI